jgi:glycosyltransferase involved in cell wall biosynthesis
MAKEREQKKVKVLAYCDSPTCATGFATVSRNIFEGLYRTGRYEIDICGINYWGDPHGFPYRIWPTGTNELKDPYGRKKSANMMVGMDYDILFLLQDSFIIDFAPDVHTYARSKGKKFRSICYYPIDGAPKEQWIQNVNACDNIVAYSQFGKDETLKALPTSKEPLVIPHGVNTKEYFIAPEKDVREFRAQYFGSLADKFIFTNLNRNQQRKDIPRTIAAFVEFRKHVKDSVLYLHMAKQDQGWDLTQVIKAYGLSINTDVIFPENFGPNQGYPRQIVNMIYNISDCVLSTSLGEGFGFSWIEAMATKTSVIMPDNTMFGEFINEDNGYLVKSGGDNSSLYTILPHDNEVIRPLVDVDDLVKKMLDVYNNKAEAKRRAENAYNMVTTRMDWQNNIVPMWVKLFDQAYSELNNPATAISNVEDTNIIEAETF